MIISLSTAEAEYDALTSMGKEAMRLKSLIEDIFGPQKLPSILYIDKGHVESVGENALFWRADRINTSQTIRSSAIIYNSCELPSM